MNQDTNLAALTKCEAEVMDVVWSREHVTVGDVMRAIPRSLAYTTVMSTLSILERKNFVSRGAKRGRALTYSARISRSDVQKRMLATLTNDFFAGSVQALVLCLLQSDAVSCEDVEAVKQLAATLDSE